MPLNSFFTWREICEAESCAKRNAEGYASQIFRLGPALGLAFAAYRTVPKIQNPKTIPISQCRILVPCRHPTSSVGTNISNLPHRYMMSFNDEDMSACPLLRKRRQSQTSPLSGPDKFQVAVEFVRTNPMSTQ